jgi:hypothetical protein
VLTVTAVNEGNSSVPVALRCALDIGAGELFAGDSGRLLCEAAFQPAAHSQLTGREDSTDIFSCLLPDPPGLVEVASAAGPAVSSEWDYPMDPSVNLSLRPGVLLYWPERALGPHEHFRARVLLTPGPAETIALAQNDLSVRSLSVTPGSDIEQRARRVVLEVGNAGPATDVDATLLFMLEDRPFSIKFLSVHVEWNRTAGSGFDWVPSTAGNYTVWLILPLLDDRDPTDNVLSEKAEVRANPYRYVLKYTTGELTSQYKSYGGSRFRVQLFVFNTGFAGDSYGVSVEGLPECWTAQLSSNYAVLEPNQMAYVWLTVHPDYATPLGTYAFDIIGTSNATHESRSLLMIVVIGPPPPAPTNGLPVNYQNLIPGNGSVAPPSTIRPYASPDISRAGWFAQGDSDRFAFGALSILGVVTAVLILVAAFYQASREHTFNVLRRIIKRALYGLIEGDEYRMIIFDAYRKMCAHLEKFGYTREENVTPREFARALRLALPLDTRSIRMLTRLFEEARYSDHRIGARDREAAIESLRHIELELDKLTTFLEKPSALQRLKRRIGLGET